MPACPRSHASPHEKSLQGGAGASQLEDSPGSNRDPAEPKTNNEIVRKFMGVDLLYNGVPACCAVT